MRHRVPALLGGLGLVMVLVAAGCRPSPSVSDQQVTDALDAVAQWLAVDDEGLTVDRAAARAREVVTATRPLVEARASIDGLDDAQAQAFYDALEALRDSVARQEAVLDDCQRPDPAACIARSALDPAELAEAVEQFQDAIAPLGPARADGRAQVIPAGPAARPGAVVEPGDPGAPPAPDTRTRPSA